MTDARSQAPESGQDHEAFRARAHAAHHVDSSHQAHSSDHADGQHPVDSPHPVDGPHQAGHGRDGERRGYPAKRRAILDAAAQVFLSEGYARASVDAIAAAAGVSKQTVYNHFGDKERLLIAVTGTIQGEAVEAQERMLAAAFPDLERLREPGRLREELLQLTIAWVRLVQSEQLSALRNLVYTEAKHHAQVMEHWLQNGPRRVLPQLNRLLVRLGDAGLLDIPPAMTEDPERLAHQLTGAANYELQLSKFNGASEDVLDDPLTRKLVGNGVDFFLRAYAPR
ncbi:MAG: TetR/AcrR family transcriptional regulator [Actinocrinis sp.]